MNEEHRDPLVDAAAAERARRADLERLIRWFFPPLVVPEAMFVAWHSSGFQPLAFHSHSADGIGLFDIAPRDVGLSEDQAWLLQSPIRNVAFASKLWQSGGWSYWDDVDWAQLSPLFGKE